MRGKTMYGFTVAALILSAAITAHAAVTIAAPEVEVKSVGAGLGLLAAGVLILQSRRNKKS